MFELHRRSIIDMKYPIKQTDRRRVKDVDADGLVELMARTALFGAAVMAPEYPSADRITVGLRFTIAETSFHGPHVLYEAGPKSGWMPSEIAGCETFRNDELDIDHVRFKRQIEVDNWMEVTPELIRRRAIEEAGDLLERTMLAAVRHFSDDQQHDGVGIHIWTR